jgi:hypothetical protein
MFRRHRCLDSAARKHFGGYRQAVEGAGLEYPPKAPLEFWTRPVVLATLRRLHADGVDLSYAHVKKTHQPLFAAAKYYFDKYHRALTHAGSRVLQSTVIIKNTATCLAQGKYSSADQLLKEIGDRIAKIQ